MNRIIAEVLDLIAFCLVVKEDAKSMDIIIYISRI